MRQDFFPGSNEPKPLLVTATFTREGKLDETMIFNWNDRGDMRKFAQRADEVVRTGGTSSVKANS